MTGLLKWTHKKDFRNLYEGPKLNFPLMGSGLVSCMCLFSLVFQHCKARAKLSHLRLQGGSWSQGVCVGINKDLHLV